MARGKCKRQERAAVNGGEGGDLAPDSQSEPDDVALGRIIMQELVGALWLPAGVSETERKHRIRVAFDRLKNLAPNGPVEGMLAAQMVATHSAAMDCLRRAMLEGQSFEGRNLNLKHAEKLLSLYARQVEALDRHRGKGKQKVTVEYVHVESGAQAIVGNVEAGRRERRRGKPRDPALEHAPEPPVEAPAPAAAAARRRG